MTKKQFKISGMHCTSCAFNIDGELEEMGGVKQASTNYARQITEIEFDEALVPEGKIIKIIENLGYTATPLL